MSEIVQLQERRLVRGLVTIAAEAHSNLQTIRDQEEVEMRRFNHSIEEYQRRLVESAREEGFEVVMQDGSAFMRVPLVDDDGGESVSEVNLTRFAEAMARKLS